MKIGIDARFYGPRVGGGGIGRYVAQLVDHLQLIDQKNEYVLFLGKENFHECVIRNPRFYKQLVDVHWYTLAEQRIMPKAVRRARVDFMHYPHWNIPIFSRVPFVVTIHDLILLEDRMSARTTTRGPLVHGFKYAGFRTVLETAIHRSKHILTVSEYTKESILRHFGVKEKKISVIHNGILPPQDTRDVSLTKLGVYEPYFLYVGNAYPHKNLEMLMHAFAAFSQDNPYVQLVIAGRRDVFSRRLENEAQEIGINREALRFIDLPTDQEIAKLYQNAKLFIYPSRIEGFGMPPLEAMSYGTPVAAARAASLPEVLANAASYFDPDDIEALTRIMQQTINSGTQSAQHIQSRKNQANQFTWESVAQSTLDVYNRIKRS